jgi:hypothetical protein
MNRRLFWFRPTRTFEATATWRTDMTWIASLLASLIGAAFGATAASMYAFRREFRQEARRAFVKAARDSQSFVSRQLHWFMLLDRGDWLGSELDKADDSKSDVYKDMQEMWTTNLADTVEAKRQVHETIAELKSDYLDIAMLVDRKAKSLCDAIQKVYNATRPDGMEYDHYENVVLRPLLEEVHRQIKPLWDDIKSGD